MSIDKSKWMIVGILVMLWGIAGSAHVTAREEEMPEQGSMVCENYKKIEYVLRDGTLTISGEGDRLQEDDRYFFNARAEIRRVEFAEDCRMVDITKMFVACANLKEVRLSSHIKDMESAFDSTGLDMVPELPEGVENISHAFINCIGITQVDFAKLPATITNFTRAFQGTSITVANLVVRDGNKTGAFDYSYCFAYCPYLTDVVFDGRGLNDAAFLWLEGMCDGCGSLKNFELKNVPASNGQQGIYNGVNMFRGCSQLATVKNCGYFYYSVAGTFEDCTSLATLQTRGFRGMYAGDCLLDTFKNCRALRGTYYVAFQNTSSIYRVAKSSDSLKENVGNPFKNCGSGLSLYIGCKDLVAYLNKRNTNAKFHYWKAGDPTGGYTSQKKTIATLKLTKYKRKTKKIIGKTVKKGKVTVKVSGKTYKVTANSSGKFTVKLKKVLKKKNKIKVTVSKSGYKTKSKTFKVK